MKFLRTDKEVSVNRIPYHMPCTFAYLFCWDESGLLMH